MKYDLSDLWVVKPNPESEQSVSPEFFRKSDAEILAMMRAVGVCERCANNAVTAFRLSRVQRGEAIGFPIHRPACTDGMKAVLTMRQH
jgi:hypothetical protein